MNERTVEKTVTFQYPFVLAGYTPAFPPGTYKIEIDEERIDSLSFQAFLRTRVTFFVPEYLTRPGEAESLNFPPQELWAALDRDRNACQKARIVSLRATRKAALDRIAIERAENEGMRPLFVPDPQPRLQPTRWRE